MSAPDGKLKKPYQSLCGFKKTDWLKPKQSQAIDIVFDLLDFTSFDTETASYILEKGKYTVRVGRNSADTNAVCTVEVEETFIQKKVLNRFVTNEKIKEIQCTKVEKESADKLPNLKASVNGIDTLDLTTQPRFAEIKKMRAVTFDDVLNENCTAKELAACLNDEQLAFFLRATDLKSKSL